MMLVGNQWLRIGGILSFAVALLHLVIIFVGAPAYRYFGAGEDMARAAESGAVFPALLTFVLVVIFVLWGLYALSGAGVIRRLPLLRMALIVIGVIYALRGVAVFQQIFQMVTSSAQVEARQIVFSSVSLAIGLAYLIGTMKNWRTLGAGNRAIQT
jgi:magnesium-transporting ATPase (P-type)